MSYQFSSLYIKSDDGHTGVIVGETKTQWIVEATFGQLRVMKTSHRQVGTPTRYWTRKDYADVN